MVTQEEVYSGFYENKLQYAEFLLNMKQDKFNYINKDLASGKLDFFSFFRMNLRGEILNTLMEHSHLFKKTINVYMADMFLFVQSSRSIDGFESILQRANINDQNINSTIKESSDKKGWIFGLGRQGNNARQEG